MIKIKKDFHTFQHLIAQQFANTIATNEFKVYFKNKELEKLWKQFSFYNNLTKKFYELVYKASLYGTMFLGIYPQKIRDKQIPFFIIGIPVSYTYFGNTLVQLEIIIDTYRENGIDWFVVENWNKQESDNSFFVERKLTDKNGIEKKISDSDYKKFDEVEFSEFDIIPYVAFYANGTNEPDGFNVDPRLYKDFDNHIDILYSDSIIAKGITYLNTPNIQGTKDSIVSLTKALNDPKATIYENRNIFSMLQNGGIQIQQGLFNGNGIIEKLRYYENQIKKFSFSKISTNDMGTKNLHNNEVETLNSDSDDYVENKANIAEQSLMLFFDLVFSEYMKLYYPNTTIDIEKIDVEVVGSTKFLLNVANKYIQNQNAVLTNPNDLSNNNNQNNQGKEEGDNEWKS